jgi:hypothetical protein
MLKMLGPPVLPLQHVALAADIFAPVTYFTGAQSPHGLRVHLSAKWGVRPSHGTGDKALGEANMKHLKIRLRDWLKGFVEFWLNELAAPKP